jgi:chromosome segregation ATPase
VTEAELRKLAEEGRACELILGGQLQRSEQRLEALSSDPTSSLVEIAAALREVNELRPNLDELEALLGAVQGRAREFRVRWVSSPSS